MGFTPSSFNDYKDTNPVLSNHLLIKLQVMNNLLEVTVSPDWVQKPWGFIYSLDYVSNFQMTKSNSMPQTQLFFIEQSVKQQVCAYWYLRVCVCTNMYRNWKTKLQGPYFYKFRKNRTATTVSCCTRDGAIYRVLTFLLKQKNMIFHKTAIIRCTGVILA